MGWQFNPEYKQLESPFKEYHDTKTTQATIKELLKDGTPPWFSHPEEYKQMALESYAYDKEVSDGMVSDYRMEDMDILLDFKARNVNIISTKDFVLKLREHGVPCLALFNGMPQTVGLWAIVPTTHGSDVRPICFMQIPAMIEWSVLAIDEHGLPAGEEYRGWRTVLAELIKKGAITEERAHEIFGRPTESVVSRRYRRTLFGFRHRKENIETPTGFVRD
jgi:hypothetical protein